MSDKQEFVQRVYQLDKKSLRELFTRLQKGNGTLGQLMFISKVYTARVQGKTYRKILL